jgi:hypothetical protein
MQPWEWDHVSPYLPHAGGRGVATTSKHRGKGQQEICMDLVLIVLARRYELMLELALPDYRFCVMPEGKLEVFNLEMGMKNCII